jgi:hypothetical protein
MRERVFRRVLAHEADFLPDDWHTIAVERLPAGIEVALVERESESGAKDGETDEE